MTRSDEDIIRTVNKHLNLLALKRDLQGGEVSRIHELLEKGNVVFSGEFSGFHLLEDDDCCAVTDCAHPLTTACFD
jgi:hypothetical protein